MRCEQASEMMSLHLDHRLSAVAELDQHMARCVACSGQWISLQAVDRLFDHPPMIQPPPDFAERVMVRIAARQAARVNPWQVLGGFLLLALGAVILGLALLSPVALDAWTTVSATWTAAGLSGLLALALHLQDVLLTLPRVVLSALRVVPTPLLFGYMMTTLLLATAWVVLVSHLNLQRHASRV